ncbi:MAG TPA: GntR family transcriptional regulator [Stellaceae bacterium]|nr:GntR family transcriptional regulator [Stellaceae bacterium]
MRSDGRRGNPEPGFARRPPKYTLIGSTLRDRILTGHYRPEMQLPSESALQAEFGVSRVTIRLALDVLRRTGFVESRQGKGYLVQPMRALHDLGRLRGFGEIMAAVGVEAHSIVVDIVEGPPSTEVLRALHLDRGAEVVTIRRVRMAGGVPLSFDVSHFPVDIGRQLAKLDLARSDIFVLIEDVLDVGLGFADLTLDVGAADDDAAAHIDVRKGEPLLRITRLTYDIKRRPIDFEYLFARPGAFKFGVRVPRG